MARAVAGAKADDKRRRLTEAGLELVETTPYAEITVALIAERAGLARSSVFYYFEDKEELFRGVVRDMLDELRQMFDTNDPSAAHDPREWLRQEVDIFLDFVTTHPQAMETIAGQGWEDLQDGAGTTMMDFTTGRIQQAFGRSPQDELLDAALHSWSQHCVDLAIRTQRTAPHADRNKVAALLVGQLEAVFSVLDTTTHAG